MDDYTWQDAAEDADIDRRIKGGCICLDDPDKADECAYCDQQETNWEAEQYNAAIDAAWNARFY